MCLKFPMSFCALIAHFIVCLFFLRFHFRCGPFFKVFIDFVTILLLFYALVFWSWGMWYLFSPTRDQTHIPCIGRSNFNHWTTPIAHFLLSVNNSPLFGCTIVCLYMHLLKDIYQVLAIMNEASINFCEQDVV